MQTAYIQVEDQMQNALSEYFQLVVFIKKLEQNGSCFSIPYTPLEDNLVQIGNSDFEGYQQHTIADGDLLIQLFQYAGKKYVIAPHVSREKLNPVLPTSIAKQSKANFIIPTFILLLLFFFLGVIGYQSYEEYNQLKINQEAIGTDLNMQTKNIELLSTQIQNEADFKKEIQRSIQREVDLINKSLENQHRSLQNISYWNRMQFDQLEKMIQIAMQDSIE